MIEILVRFLRNGRENIVYTGQPNDLTLELTNLSDEPIDVTAGAPVDPPEDGPFSISVSFAELFTDPAQQGQLSITASGWTAKFFPGPFGSWVLTRESPTTWERGATFKFAIQNLTPTVSAGPYRVWTSIYNVEPFPIAQSQPMTAAVQSDGANLPATFRVDVKPAVVYGTKTSAQIIANEIEVTFINTDATSPLVPDDVSWGSTPPQFVVSFIYGNAPGAFALTTSDAAAAFETAIAQGFGWNAPLRRDGPSWLMTPLPTNHAVLGTGVAAFVTFRFSNIVTSFLPGVTQMYVQYANVPGYQDGNLSVILHKEYKPAVIRNFEINQTRFSAGERGFLNWQADNTMLVQLSDVGAVPREGGREVEVTHDQSFVLSAIDPMTNAYLTARRNAAVVPSMTSRTIPPGMILLWSGSIDDVPPGFAVCDGTNGTPDLRNRFVPGASAATANTKGADTHTHAFGTRTNATYPTTFGGEHGHIPCPPDWKWRDLANASTFPHPGIDVGGRNNFNRSLQWSGEHRHTVPINVPGGTSDVNDPELRPRWYALLYIMKRRAA